MKQPVLPCHVLVMVTCLLGPISAFAQDEEKKPDPKVLAAEKVLDRFANAVGEKEALAKIKTRVVKGNIQLGGKKYGQMVRHLKAPNSMHTHFILPNDNYFQLTTDGKHVWRVDSVTRKPKLIDPLNEEAIGTVHKAAIDGNVNWRKYLKSWILKEEVEVKGKTLYKEGKKADHLVLETNARFGPILHQYYDKENGLLIKTKQQIPEEGRYVWTETYMSDYKKVDGILLPHQISIQIKGIPIDILVAEVKHNVTIPEQYFRLPESLKSQID
ncbi:MAG: hypothetical protein ACFCD0_17765 [Gemmataceae bacterium]